MAPGQVPHQSTHWRDAHPFFLLSPLMGLLSWAWSRLKGPGAPEPSLVEAITSTDQGEAGLVGEAKASLAIHCAPWGKHHPQGEARDSGTAEKDGEVSWGACPDLKANSTLLKDWELPDDDDNDEYGREEATSALGEQGSKYRGGQSAPLSPSLLRRTLQDPPGEEEPEKGGVAEDKVTTFSSFGSSHWEYCPGVKGEGEDGEAVNKEAPRTASSSLYPRPKPRAWVYYAREEEAQAKEEEVKTENKEGKKPSISPSSARSSSSTWECCSGEESEEEKEGKAEKGEADSRPQSILAQRPLFRTWQPQSSKITEEEDEDNASGEAESLSSNTPTSTFLRAWVYRPGEDTEEEEDEDSDSGAAEEEGEAEGPSSIPPTSTFMRAWVYRPGEDTEEEDEEDSDSGAAEEGEAEGPSSIPPTSAFMRAWVYRPGEDTEEEEEEDEEKDDSEAADSGPSSSLQAQSALFRGLTYPSGEETEGGEAAEEWEEAEPHPFRVTIYLPGEKPPPPWAPPRLPLRLQRQLKCAETPTQHLEPETPQKARKVRFSEKVSIHFLVVWAGPAQAARRGPWEQLARDRSHFARRIAQTEEKLSPYLTPAARTRAWTRLRNPPLSLAALSAPSQTLPHPPSRPCP